MLRVRREFSWALTLSGCSLRWQKRWWMEELSVGFIRGLEAAERAVEFEIHQREQLELIGEESGEGDRQLMLPEKVLRELREERAVGGGDGEGDLEFKKGEGALLSSREKVEAEEEGKKKEGGKGGGGSN